MKKSYAFAFASSIFLLGSCASDAPVLNENTTPSEADNGDGYYLRVEMPSQAGTRAKGDFVTDINSVAFVFFDANGDHIATRRIGGEHTVEGETDIIDWITDDASHTPDHSVSKCAVLKLSSVPSTVQCLVNAPKGHDKVDADLSEYDEELFYYEDDDNNYITMSSSTYYTAKKTDAKIVYWSTIDPKKHLFSSKANATKLDETYTDGGTTKYKEALKIYVEPIMAKVNITKDNTIGTNIDNVDNGEVVDEANVSFNPEYVFLTGWNNQGNAVKDLPAFSALRFDLKNWDEITTPASRISGWVGDCAGSVVWATLDGIQNGNGYTYLPGTADANRYKFNGTKTYYPFENKDIDDKVNRTNVVVCGKYTVVDAENNSLAADDGTFYLVGIGDKFKVFATEEAAIAEAGGVEGDKLVPEGVTNAAVTPQTNYTGWTGKMVIEGKTYLPKIIKYTGGYGYYSRTINRTTINTTNYPAIVRNTEYNLNIKSIKGMGVGIPSKYTPIIPVTPPNPNDEDMYLHIAVTVNPWVSLPPTDVVWE